MFAKLERGHEGPCTRKLARAELDSYPTRVLSLSERHIIKVGYECSLPRSHSAILTKEGDTSNQEGTALPAPRRTSLSPRLGESGRFDLESANGLLPSEQRLPIDDKPLLTQENGINHSAIQVIVKAIKKLKKHVIDVDHYTIVLKFFLDPVG